jgi:hypothetical protein
MRFMSRVKKLSRRIRGNTIRMITGVEMVLVALRLPMIQRMDVWTSRDVAMVKMNITTEERRKLKTTPLSMMVVVEKSFRVDMKITAVMLMRQPAKHSPTKDRPESPRVMAMVAPRAPPAETPKVKGSAKGFLSTA